MCAARDAATVTQITAEEKAASAAVHLAAAERERDDALQRAKVRGVWVLSALHAVGFRRSPSSSSVSTLILLAKLSPPLLHFLHRLHQTP